MITVDYVYKVKSDNKWKYAHKQFTSVNKAIRFIYKINASPTMAYDGFTCDSTEEQEEMNKRL